MDETTSNPIVNIALDIAEPIIPIQPLKKLIIPTGGQLVDNSPKPKHAGGRPCEFCTNKETILAKTKQYIESGKGEKPKILFLNELAVIVLGKHRETITLWATERKDDGSLKHPEFSDLIKELEELQEFRLQQRVLGRYNPTGSIFLLKTKHGYIETEKKVHTGDTNEPIQIKIIEDKKLDE